MDEAYLDVTHIVKDRLKQSKSISRENLTNTHIVGWNMNDFLQNLESDEYFTEKNLWLAMGAVIAEEIRTAVLSKTGMYYNVVFFSIQHLFIFNPFLLVKS